MPIPRLMTLAGRAVAKGRWHYARCQFFSIPDECYAEILQHFSWSELIDQSYNFKLPTQENALLAILTPERLLQANPSTLIMFWKKFSASIKITSLLLDYFESINDNDYVLFCQHLLRKEIIYQYDLEQGLALLQKILYSSHRTPELCMLVLAMQLLLIKYHGYQKDHKVPLLKTEEIIAIDHPQQFFIKLKQLMLIGSVNGRYWFLMGLLQMFYTDRSVYVADLLVDRIYSYPDDYNQCALLIANANERELQALLTKVLTVVVSEDSKQERAISFLGEMFPFIPEKHQILLVECLRNLGSTSFFAVVAFRVLCQTMPFLSHSNRERLLSISLSEQWFDLIKSGVEIFSTGEKEKLLAAKRSEESWSLGAIYLYGLFKIRLTADSYAELSVLLLPYLCKDSHGDRPRSQVNSCNIALLALVSAIQHFDRSICSVYIEPIVGCVADSKLDTPIVGKAVIALAQHLSEDDRKLLMAKLTAYIQRISLETLEYLLPFMDEAEQKHALNVVLDRLLGYSRKAWESLQRIMSVASPNLRLFLIALIMEKLHHDAKDTKMKGVKMGIVLFSYLESTQQDKLLNEMCLVKETNFPVTLIPSFTDAQRLKFLQTAFTAEQAENKWHDEVLIKNYLALITTLSPENRTPYLTAAYELLTRFLVAATKKDWPTAEDKKNINRITHYASIIFPFLSRVQRFEFVSLLMTTPRYIGSFGDKKHYDVNIYGECLLLDLTDEELDRVFSVSKIEFEPIAGAIYKAACTRIIAKPASTEAEQRVLSMS